MENTDKEEKKQAALTRAEQINRIETLRAAIIGARNSETPTNLEDRLKTQAKGMNAAFEDILAHARSAGKTLEHLDTAIKLQKQCCRTLIAIEALKNPKTLKLNKKLF